MLSSRDGSENPKEFEKGFHSQAVQIIPYTYISTVLGFHSALLIEKSCRMKTFSTGNLTVKSASSSEAPVIAPYRIWFLFHHDDNTKCTYLPKLQ